MKEIKDCFDPKAGTDVTAGSSNTQENPSFRFEFSHKPDVVDEAKKNKRRSRQNQLNFHQLESRQLLAGDFAGPHQGDFSAPSNSNLVTNGDFETVVAGNDNFYDQEDVGGWSARDAATGQQINILNYQGYGNVLDLDSTEHHFDRVFKH